VRQNVRILGWCFIVYGGILAIIGVGVGMIVLGGGAMSGDRQAMFITGAVGAGIAVLMIILSLPSIIAGLGLLKFRSWARILAIILGALHLLSFPFGTALGIFTLIVLLNQEAVPLFH
jgi:hypothetical protein